MWPNHRCLAFVCLGRGAALLRPTYVMWANLRYVVFVRLGRGTARLGEIHEQDRDMTYDASYVACVSCDISCAS